MRMAFRRQWQAGTARHEDLEEETNAKGGLLGRPVKPSTTMTRAIDRSGIYTKPLDVDKADLVVGVAPPTWLHPRCR
jgi:hypothetical protein